MQAKNMIADSSEIIFECYLFFKTTLSVSTCNVSIDNIFNQISRVIRSTQTCIGTHKLVYDECCYYFLHHFNHENKGLGQISTDINAMKQENKQLKEKIEMQDKRIEFLEREGRKKNLVIMGVADKEGEGEKEMLDKITLLMSNIGVEMDKEIELEDYIRLGKFREAGTRPILIKLRKFSKKMEILKHAKNLKGTDIWINEDYTKEVQEERKKLIPMMKEARSKGHKALIKYNKLIINNEVYDMERNDLASQQKLRKVYSSEASTSTKRLVSERSPEEDTLGAQLRKITKKTTWTKN
ncbi:hypothetical protein RI129_006237 [Pyrocoelia pectoralis]|uniref:Endonuclease-reverse transcriptase n=1 Tax=Pyrocoelia pectoralis TaxID=417401 RepID=A0AAN7VC41_9COLE